MAYIGAAPGVSSQRLEDTFFATAGQTTFVATAGYVPGNIDVYRNGVKLANGTEFTASNGINVVLTTAAAAGDSVVLLSYIPRGLSDGYTKTEADAKYLTIANPSYTGTLTGGTGVINIGSGQVYKDASGNVGIGTSSPGYRLTVSGGATSLAANQYLRFGAGIFASGDGSVDNYLFTGSTSLKWRNAADSAELMQLTNGGNLGLGVTPSAWWTGAKAIQISAGMAIEARPGDATVFSIGANQYIGAAASRLYLTTNVASLYEQNAGIHRWYTAPSGTAGSVVSFQNAMTLTGGNVTELRLVSSGSLATGSASIVRFGGTNSAVSGYVGYGGNANGYDVWNTLAGPIAFGTSNLTRGQFLAGGDFVIGKSVASESYTSGNGYGFAAATVDPFFSIVNVSSGGQNSCIYLNRRNVNSSNGLMTFISNDGSSQVNVGGISHNGTSTSYVTSSDYRLKTNIQPMTGALAFVRQQRPVTYEWISNGLPAKGYIAHWLQEDGAGDCVAGEKDAVDANNNPIYQGVDASFMVAPLNAAVNELADIVDQQAALIASLTSRLEALETQ